MVRLFSLSLLITGALSAPSYGVNGTECRCRPSEPCWPSDADWQSLNETVNGQLSRVSPLGAVCHDPEYDEEACTTLLSGGAYDSSIRAASPGRFRDNRYPLRHGTNMLHRRWPVDQLGGLGGAEPKLLRRSSPLRALPARPHITLLSRCTLRGGHCCGG